jgi:hypothetical protein
MYAPDYQRSSSPDKKNDLPYALIYTEKRLGGTALPSLDRNTRITLPIRRVSFHGSTSQVLVIYMPRNGCLRVLDPARGDDVTYGNQSRFLVDAIPLSDLSNIIVDPHQVAKPPFVSEPDHTWCYYFAKAELARQRGDWGQVIDLIDEARSFGYEPEDPFEWLTYIEAQAHAGNMEDALTASRDASEQDNRIRRGLCELWERIQTTEPATEEELIRMNQILSEYQCR